MPLDKAKIRRAFSAASTSYDTAVSLNIASDGANLYYSTRLLAVNAGSARKLTFKNTAPADSGMSPNWVLTQPGAAEPSATEDMRAGKTKDWVAGWSQNQRRYEAD